MASKVSPGCTVYRVGVGVIVDVKVGIGVIGTGVKEARGVNVKVAVTVGRATAGVPVGIGVMIWPQLIANRAKAIRGKLDIFSTRPFIMPLRLYTGCSNMKILDIEHMFV
jgi:hypothetical protein